MHFVYREMPSLSPDLKESIISPQTDIYLTENR